MSDVITSEEELQDKQQSLAAAKQAIAGPTPLIEEAPDTSVVLPRGLFVSGTFKRQAVVRELTGADEEQLAKAKDGADLFDQAIALGTTSIDDFDLSSMPVVERQTWLRMLLIGEREQLFLAISKVTFGETRTINFTCSMCDERQETDLLLSEDFKPVEIDPSLSLEAFDYRTKNGDDLVVRLVTGDDQNEAFTRKGASIPEQNTIILSRVITKLNSGLVLDPTGYARGLSISDREKLLAELTRRQPSISLGVTTKCAACNADQTLNINWGMLFAPDEQTLYLNYDFLSTAYPGWTLTEIRTMTRRQRHYWNKMARWKREKSLG